VLLGPSWAAGEVETFEIPVAAHPGVSPALNHGYGLVLPNYRPGSNDQKNLGNLFPHAGIVYKRFLWSELEPEEGKFQFSLLEDWINGWKKRGYRVGFGVMSMTDGKQAAPLWLFKAGVPGVRHARGKQTDPVMWDARYLDKMEHFVAALGKRLNGGRDIEFIDMRGIGMWGEMHFGLGIKGMWTADELYEHGLSEEALAKAYFREMDMYKKAFPQTTLFLNISTGRESILSMAPHYQAFFLPDSNAAYKQQALRRKVLKPFILPISDKIHQHAVESGIGLRFDGLGEEELKTKMISQYFRKYCAPGGPVKCFYEFAQEEKDPDEIRDMLNFALEDHAAYVNINFQELKSMKKETLRILRDAAGKIGYQLRLTRLRLQYETRPARNKPFLIGIRHSWVNTGNLAADDDFALRFALLDEAGNIVSGMEVRPKPGVSTWLPGTRIELDTLFTIPSLPDESQQYYLSLSMIDRLGRSVNLHLRKEEYKDDYIVARISLKEEKTIHQPSNVKIKK